MNSSVTLDSFKIFYEVAKTSNLTKASENLFISQPAVSQSIKKLEECLGVVLLIRSKKGITLTSIGKKIFEKVELAMHNFNLIDTIINEEKGLIQGDLVIASGSTIAREILCDKIAKFIKKYPSINFKMIESTQSEMISSLSSGKIDLMITQENSNIKFPFIPLFETKYCLVKKIGAKTNKIISMIEGSFNYNLVCDIINNKFIPKETTRLNKDSIIQISGYRTAIELACQGTAFALVPQYLAKPYLDEKKLEEIQLKKSLPTITFGIYYNKNLMTPACLKFLEIMNLKI